MTLLRRASNHFDPPSKGVIAFGAEEINVILELQFEHKVLVDRVLLRRSRHGVPQQRQSSQREVVLMRLIEEQAEVREHDPELLPAVTVLEFPQQKSAQLVLKRAQLIAVANTRVSMPANVHGRVASLGGLRAPAASSLRLESNAIAHLVGRA